MDAMREALRRKIMAMKGQGAGGPLQGPAGEGDAEKEGSDLAPALQGEPTGIMEAGTMGEDGEEIDQAQLLEILAALADHESGSGRSPSGLQERAAVGARAKLDGLKKGSKEKEY